MRDETLADVYASNVTGAQYDAGMKNLMSNKEIIVPLLQLTYRPKKPSYPILKRALYYVARDLSSQLSVVTNTTDYSKLEKCYSIWICTKDIPKRLQNTMTEYSFTRKDMIGTAEEPLEYYDLMSVIIIRRGREPDEKGIFDYLAGLFSSDVKRIEEYSHIEWSEPFQKEVGNMTGFGDEIYRKGIQSGKIEGLLEGRREGQILGALMCGKTPEQVSEMFNVSLEKVIEIQEKELLVK